jgi:hypothetical protein
MIVTVFEFVDRAVPPISYCKPAVLTIGVPADVPVTGVCARPGWDSAPTRTHVIKHEPAKTRGRDLILTPLDEIRRINVCPTL